MFRVTKQQLFFVLQFLFFYSSCIDDPLDLNLDFEGPGEITVNIQSGTFTGMSYPIISLSQNKDHQFFNADKLNKVLCQPLQSRDSLTLKQSSFINWAWIGDTISGNFSAIFANDTSVSNSGNIQLQFESGDEINTSIPKGTIIKILKYGNSGGALEGQFDFIAPLDYKLNGIFKREIASFMVIFKIKRGPIIL